MAPSFHHNSVFSFGPCVILVQLISTTDTHFVCIFINTDASVVPDTLTDMLLNLYTCSRRPLRI